MNRGIYIASTGMLAAQTQSEIIADNIANLKTPGYKEELSIKEAFPKMLLTRLESLIPYNAKPIGERGDGVKVSRIAHNTALGIIDKTEKSEDLALATEGYFTVLTPDGERYTRNGHFQINDKGTLTTPEGFAVLGLKGEITGLSDGFNVNNDGTISLNEKVIDKLLVVQPAKDSLKREGQSLYSSEEKPLQAEEVQILQGNLERSNVDLAGQMQKMVVVMRTYEANQKVIQAQDSALDKAVNEIGKI